MHTAPRGFTLRSVVVALFALLAMSLWIEYVEKIAVGGPLAENSPPNSAVGLILGVMGLSVLLYGLRRSLRLVPAELVVIYTALVLAAPLMTQGLWGRLCGLLAAVPHNQDFKSYESLPPMLWPHGRNVVPNSRFTKGMEGFEHTGGGRLSWKLVDRQAKGRWNTPVLSNDGQEDARSSLACSLDRYDRTGRELLVPGERFLVSALVRTEGFQKGSFYFVEMAADSGPPRSLLLSSTETHPTFANPDGFRRIGVSPVLIPTELREKLTVRIGLSGPGTLELQDVQFLNVEAIEGLYAGRRMIRESRLADLPANQRDFTVVRPDNLFTLRGLKYLVTGYIPLGQWVMPAAAWTLLIVALFMGLIGLNTLMRKQWADHERFSFPMTILPRNLFAEADDGHGGKSYPIWRNRIMWIGFAVTLPLVLLKGLKFYNPAVPALVVKFGSFSDYVTSPVLKAYLENVGFGGNIGLGISFCVLAIALLVETDILFTLWASFFLFQFWNMFGKLFNWSRFPGYPWSFQQSMGAFIAYAGVALLVARRHLREVFVRIIGRSIPDEPLPAAENTTTYRVALLMIVAAIGILAAWGAWTRMGVATSLLFFGYLLIIGFAASKIRAECGAPFAYLTPYFGMQFVAAVGGFAVFGSTGMLVATIVSGFATTSCFLLTGPVQVEMMELGRQFDVRLRDVHAGLWLGLLGGLFLGGFVVLCWAYGFGANSLNYYWPYEQNWFFTSFRIGEVNADRAFANGTLFTTAETRPLDVVHNLDAKGLGIGALITVILAVLRSKFMWFPFHPIGYVLAATFFMKGLWPLALLAWLVRMIVFRIGGAQVIRKGLVPFCVGMFLASIASVVFFSIVSVVLQGRGIMNTYNGLP
jgi:hypothetical protein